MAPIQTPNRFTIKLISSINSLKNSSYVHELLLLFFMFAIIGAHFIGGEREDEGVVDNRRQAHRICGGVRNKGRGI